MKFFLLSIFFTVFGYLASDVSTLWKQSRDWNKHRMAMREFALWLNSLPHEEDFRLPSIEELKSQAKFSDYKSDLVYVHSASKESESSDVNKIVAWGTRLSPQTGFRLFLVENLSVQLAFDANVDWDNYLILKIEK